MLKQSFSHLASCLKFFMNILKGIVIVDYIISLLVLWVSVQRIQDYSKNYRLEENRYTLLFGFIGLGAFTLAYIILVFVLIFSSFFYIFFFL